MITSVNNILPLYIVGDSHVLAYRNLLFRETWTGKWVSTRTKYISGLSTQQFFTPASDEFHPGLIEALHYEGLVRDHRATHLSLEEADYNIFKASGQPVLPPLLMLTCGDIDVRAALLPMLKDKYDFIPPYESRYERVGKAILAWDICEKFMLDRLSPFIAGLKRLKVSGFNRLYVPLIAPPTMDEENFFDRHGYRCAAAVRYKATVAFNRLLAEQCKAIGVPVLDIWPQVTKAGYLRPEFELDGIHLAPAAATMHLDLLLDHAINAQPSANNFPRHELHYRMACHPDRVFEKAEQVKATAPSPNWLKPVANIPPRLCTSEAEGKVPETAAAWVRPAVEEFARTGICVVKTDPAQALRWKELLAFDRDVGNRNSAWDWTGNTIAPFSKNILTAQAPQKLLEELEVFYSKPEFEHFFQGVLGCPVTVVNCRPVQSIPHDSGSHGPQSWHTDGCPAGIIRGIYYLTDVDETSGPFQYKGADDSTNTMLGQHGDLLIFDAMRLVHRALPPSKNARTVLDFVFMPRLKGEKLQVLAAGMNNWPGDAFCYSPPSDKTGLRSGTERSGGDSGAEALVAQTKALEAHRAQLQEMASEVEYLNRAVQSASSWQKRSWVKRAFHQWRPPKR